MLSLLLMLVAVFPVRIGEVVALTFPHEAGIRSMQVAWQNKKVPLVKVGDNWTTVIGIDLDVKPGNYTAAVTVTSDGGRTEARETTIQVGNRQFPTTRLRVAERFVQLNPADEKRAASEATELNRIYDTITPEILWSRPFTVPIPGGSGTNFGHRRVFNGQSRAPHAGADLKASTGTPIYSTNRGRVVLARDLFFTGNTVVVDHGLGIYTIYAHLSKIDVKPGAVVENGALLGLAGATGRVTGPHLHWSARVQGARVDPFSLVNLSD
jgi:murein DD-endopeptidase MepM/ murein hydrolase activator NlpD